MQVLNENQYTRPSVKIIKLEPLLQYRTKLDLAIS